MRWNTLLALVACNPPAEEAESCLQPLGAWCNGPEGPADCEPAPYEDLLPCGGYEVRANGGGTGGSYDYFLDGVHVATQYTSDVWEYCGDSSFVLWFGEEVECKIEWPDTGAY